MLNQIYFVTISDILKKFFFANIWENFNNFNYIENRVIHESSDWMIEKDKRDG